MAQPEIKLYGMLFSPFVRTVMGFMRLHSIPFQLEEIDTAKGQNKTPEYLAINPKGQVPAIVEGDFKLGDSTAIIQYLAESRGISNNWWPQDVKERALMVSYLHWHPGAIGMKIRTYVFRTVVGPRFLKMTFSEEEVKTARDECAEAMEKVNQMLSSGKCIAGTSDPSTADLVLLSGIQQLVVMARYDISSFSALQEWYNRLSDIDGIRSVQEELLQAIQAMASPTN